MKKLNYEEYFKGPVSDWYSAVWAEPNIMHELDLVNTKDIYHYTDINGFISIMENQELWASHIRFMNDYSEYLYGEKMFIKEIDKKMPEVSEEEKEILQRVKKSLQNVVSEGILSHSKEDVFSLSFSQNENSLEMWRGYSKNSGIAIGFDFSEYAENLRLVGTETYEELLEKAGGKVEKICPEKEHVFFTVKVCYDKEEKEALIKNILELGLVYAENYKEKEGDKDPIIPTVGYLSDLIFDFIPYLKQEGFRGEEEYRILYNHLSDEDKSKGIHYRGRKGIILPYIKCKMIDKNCRILEKLPIKKIIIGPGLNQDKVKESVEYFLKKKGQSYLVEKSDIPYVPM